MVCKHPKISGNWNSIDMESICEVFTWGIIFFIHANGKVIIDTLIEWFRAREKRLEYDVEGS